MAKVFLVDDSKIVTKMVSEFLMEKGYAVDVANSPFGVSGKLKEFEPDIVLMDLGLPGLSGHKLIDLIKKRDSGLNCKVILFSSTNEEEMRTLVKEGHADDYFVKGSSLNDLESKIRKLTA